MVPKPSGPATANRGRLRAGVRRLRGLRRAGKATALLVPVPEADFLLEELAGTGARLGIPGLPPHVTVLYPFLDDSEISDAVERELTTLAAAKRQFTYVLGAVDRFPDALYLSITPAAGFIALTEAVEARWPTHPLHGGKFAEVRPHLTLAYGREPDGLAAAVEPWLPIPAVARELILMMRNASGEWRPQLRCPLSESASPPKR